MQQKKKTLLAIFLSVGILGFATIPIGYSIGAEAQSVIKDGVESTVEILRKHSIRPSGNHKIENHYFVVRGERLPEDEVQLGVNKEEYDSYSEGQRIIVSHLPGQTNPLFFGGKQEVGKVLSMANLVKIAGSVVCVASILGVLLTTFYHPRATRGPEHQ